MHNVNNGWLPRIFAVGWLSQKKKKLRILETFYYDYLNSEIFTFESHWNILLNNTCVLNKGCLYKIKLEIELFWPKLVFMSLRNLKFPRILYYEDFMFAGKPLVIKLCPDTPVHLWTASHEERGAIMKQLSSVSVEKWKEASWPIINKFSLLMQKFSIKLQFKFTNPT